MADNITARDLMLPDFATIPSNRTLADAIDALVELQTDPTRANALVVLGPDHEFEGIVTAHLLFKSLLSAWTPAAPEDPMQLHQQLLSAVEDRAHLTVQDTLIQGLPTASLSDRLLALIEAGYSKRLEFIPVVENGRPFGLVPITAVFQATAALALTPEHEGIRFDQDAEDGGQP